MKITNSLRIILLSIFLSVSVNRSYSQSISPVLDSLLNRTLDSMQTVLANKSLSAAIEMPNNFNWKYATGVSGGNPLVNVQSTDIYLIGSVTKTIIAAAVLQLADSAVLNLDDSLHHWLDTMQYIDPNITIRQLLRHQSGLHDLLYHPQFQPAMLADQDSIWDPADLISTFLLPAPNQPGSSWSYCNTNFFLLGMIIEAATGDEFYTVLRNKFFSPLQLNTIGIPAFENVTSNVAHVWIDLDGDGFVDDAHNFYWNFLSLNAAGGAAGGYYSTASDLSKWMRTYMRGDLHSPQMMLEAKTTIAASGVPNGSYGLGLMKKTFLGLQAFGHGGDLSYSASSWYFPDRDISISVLNNDSRKNSWTLVPVISALLKTYNEWLLTSNVNENISESIQTSVFPNPFSDQISLSCQSKKYFKQLNFEIINLLGEKMIVTEMSNVSPSYQTVDFKNLSGLPSGIYIFNILSSDGLLKSIKLVK
jgi:CubicO group peptidase (beta-lactamase class C family)